MKVSLIIGITGQDGSYLSELLLEKGYKIYGIIRRSSNINTQRIEHIREKLNLFYGDLSDGGSIRNIFETILKENKDFSVLEIYNLGAMSHVKVSFDSPEYTGNIDALGVTRILEIIKSSQYKDKIKFYQASTSEMFGKVQEIPQTEKTPFYPRSPYGVAKLYGHWITINYRESFNIFSCSGILFNHESPRRAVTFVTRKITLGIKKILNKEIEYLELGNLDSKRDWGHTKDYVRGMWLMLQQDKPDDYILSTGVQYSVRDFVVQAFKLVGIEIKWKGNGLEEVGYNTKDNKILVKVNEKFFRPAEVETLLGSSEKAKNKLNWEPEISFEELVKEMISEDVPKFKEKN